MNTVIDENAFENEIWKDVVGFEEYYEVSNCGRVRSLPRVIRVEFAGGRIVEKRYRGRILYQNLKLKGSRQACVEVALSRGGKQTTLKVHHLVAQAFIGPRPESLEFAHFDRDVTNNRVGNLRYATHKDNCFDRVRHGTESIGERNSQAKLTESQVKQIRIACDKPRELAARFNVALSTISEIRRGRTWAHI